jgi:hypothetical protein
LLGGRRAARACSSTENRAAETELGRMWGLNCSLRYRNPGVTKEPSHQHHAPVGLTPQAQPFDRIELLSHGARHL